MSSNRPSIRRRSTVGGPQLVTLPYGDEDYLTVKFRHVRSKTVGSQKAIVPTNAHALEKSSEMWKSATDWGPDDRDDFALDIEAEAEARFEEAVDANVFNSGPEADFPQSKKTESKKPERQRSMLSKRPHVVWKELYRATYLDELTRHSGRGDFSSSKCPECVARARGSDVIGDATYRCASDCLQGDLVCQECCIRRHRQHPFHRIQRWTGTHFVGVSLKSLGLRIQLNHTRACASPEPCHSSLVILHTNGLHKVAFNFCACEKAEPRHIQMLRRRLYPASQHIIQTCASFELLNMLHKFCLTTKSAIYDFYRGLEKLTDGTGLQDIPSKYRPLLRMMMQWRHLKMLEWGGRAHDPDGPAATKPGQLAIRCPSCAYPGINMPPDWRNASKEDQYLHRLFACMDANFRLKNQLVSNYSQDPGLGIGMSYMVPRKGYEAYVLKKASDADISSCVGFQAIAQANTRFSKGLRYTGVGGIFCGRSEMVLPNGIGNLQKGERYCNMDYIFASGIVTQLELEQILISYDIACQWSINLNKRLTAPEWPVTMDTPQQHGVKLIPAIPKLHEPMHDAVNHQQYSLNCIPGVGLSDQEAPERVWAGHNQVGNSTKGQGPGSRQDVLDDNFNWWNHLKYISMGKSMLGKYRSAIADRNIQEEGHKLLSATMPDPSVVEKWTQMCTEWELNPKVAKNPYELEGSEISEAEARKDLAKAEEEFLAKGGVAVNSTSPFTFVSMALEIEQSQRKIRQLAKNMVAQATARQSSGLTEQRNHLRSRIRTWELLLPIYMPGLLQYRADLDHTTGPSPQPEQPENWVLWLPSCICSADRDRVCFPGLPEIEVKLRTGQCFSSLDALRSTLRLKSRLVTYKNKHIRGQREGTRSRAFIDRVHEKARSISEKYRRARLAKLRLSGHGDWESVLRVLEDDDVRTFQEAAPMKDSQRKGTREDEVAEQMSKKGGKKKKEGARGGVHKTIAGKPSVGRGSDVEITPQRGVTDPETSTSTEKSKSKGTGETRRTISWIWLVPSSKPTGALDADDEIMRVEWCKSRARAARAGEEVRLLKEEMRRVLKYLSWKKRWWIEQIGRRKSDRALTEGLRALAMRKSEMEGALFSKFDRMWLAPLGSFVPVDEVAVAADVLGEEGISQVEHEDPDGRAEEGEIEGEEVEAVAIEEDEPLSTTREAHDVHVDDEEGVVALEADN